ncbi:hypothetical protein Tco_0026388 [Tanacetum coccineum]
MAQQQRQADVHQDELCPPNKRYALMDANKKIDLDNPLCRNESKIMANILQNHPLRFRIAASLLVPWIYLGQFWHTLKEDGSKYRLKFFSEMVPFFLNDLGFTLELRSPSNFKMNGLVQPWQTLGKMFARCLTTRVIGHNQPLLPIMQMLYCFVNNVHVDYAELLYEGLHYALEHPSTLIPYPRFTKLIMGHYMTAYPKYHNHEHDKMVKSIFNSGKNKAGTLYSAKTVTQLTPPTPIPTAAKVKEMIVQYTIQLSIHEQKSCDDFEAKQSKEKVKEHLIAKGIEKLVEGTQNVGEDEVDNYIFNSKNDPDTRNYMSGHILHVHPTQASQAFAQKQQYQLFLTIKDNPQLQHDDLPIWLALKIKFEGLHASHTPCRSSAICPRDQDDPHDDTHSEGENSAKRQKTSKHGTYVFGESLSGQVNESEPDPSTLGNQEHLDDFDFWTDKYATNDDELLAKKASQELVEEMSETVDKAKLHKVIDEMLRQ